MSLNVSKSSYKHSCDKYTSPGANNLSLDAGDLSVRTNDVNVNGNSYVNTPSPSSIASTSTIDRSPSSKNDFHPQMSSKRHHRHDKLFHYNHSLNRQYVITMTNVLFQMQKEIYRLKRRTHHVEQILANTRQASQPIIRIPRLTRDELSTICINDDRNEQISPSAISVENETNTELSTPLTIISIELPNEQNDDTRSPITLQTESPTNMETNDQQEQEQQQPISNKYCLTCHREFSHRSAYLRHMRRIHNGIYPLESTNDNLVEIDNLPSETLTATPDQSDIGIDDESFQVLVNQWDIGEGRLRPRRVSKLNNESIKKVKCDICKKFFRPEYIKKHIRRTHRSPKASSSNDSNNTLKKKISTTAEPIDDVQTLIGESPTTNTNPPSTITIAEVDTDDIPIQFRKDSNKQIFITTTCLERDQSEIIEEFIRKFSPRVYQTASVDSRTTHLIINDDPHFLRSPLSMKLIEGIAHHCFCVSYRWIIDCLKYDRIIEEDLYEIEGDDTDLHPLGGPKRSRLIEKRHSLFENIRFMIKCTENNDIRMPNDRLQALITVCGGEIINCVTRNLLDQFEIVVLCDKLYVSERRHNYDECRSLGIHFVSSDWILESIIEYRQKMLSSYAETPL